MLGKFCALGGSVVVTCAVMAGGAAAAPITLSGADLLTDSNVSLPNGNAGTVGSSLQFTGGPGQAVIINIDLTAMGFGTGLGEISSGSVSVTNTRITGDSDLWYGLWDGTRFESFTSWDGDRSSDHTSCGVTSNGTTFTTCTGTTTSFGSIQSIGSAETALYEFDLLSGTLEFSINSVVHTSLLPGSFNTAGSLSFLVGKGSIDETHQIDSVTISDGVVRDVPEPATLALLGIGLAGLGVARRRKSA